MMTDVYTNVKTFDTQIINSIFQLGPTHRFAIQWQTLAMEPQPWAIFNVKYIRVRSTATEMRQMRADQISC